MPCVSCCAWHGASSRQFERSPLPLPWSNEHTSHRWRRAHGVNFDSKLPVCGNIDEVAVFINHLWALLDVLAHVDSSWWHEIASFYAVELAVVFDGLVACVFQRARMHV